MTATYWASTARLSLAAARARYDACSAGNTYRVLVGSTSTIPDMTIAPNHSRTYRSFSRALVAISAEVDGGDPFMESNRPVRWPIDAIKQRAPAFSAERNWPANACAFAASKVAFFSVVATMFAPQSCRMHRQVSNFTHS